MKHTILISIICILLGCGSGDSNPYPKSYTFNRLEQFPEGMFLLANSNTPISLDINSGSYGMNRLTIKSETLDLIKYAFDLKEIELLSENTARISFYSEGELLDTLFNYTIDDKNIIFQAFSNTDIIYYTPELDQFVVCAITTLALPGPNVIAPNPLYYNGNVEDCLKNSNLNDHLDYILAKDEYMPLDTICIFYTKLIYN